MERGINKDTRGGSAERFGAVEMSSEELSPSMHKFEAAAAAELNEGRFERFVAEKGKGEEKGEDKLGMESRKQKHQQTRETCRACLDEGGGRKKRD